ncbi:hypothetical protein F8388_018816 [Cannabis sativa]|uniref:Uncharacterized protein n=1 Tax=Cannabis sativa TaxID=3483 RepID=A0A7J6F6Z5_CANSA|nr:hypothetical protein F8388_018816 [Cannabis sativa]
MGLPWYRVHTVVLNDTGRLISIHIMHPRSTLSTAQTSIPFALCPPYLSACWQVGAYLCDLLRLRLSAGTLLPAG